MKKSEKRFALAAALFMLLAAVCLAVFFVGNPFFKQQVRESAEEYLSEMCPFSDYVVEDVEYDFAKGMYQAKVASLSSIDTHYPIYISLKGEILLDTYYDVMLGVNTAMRLNEEYIELVEGLYPPDKAPDYCDSASGSLVCRSRWDGDSPSFACNMEDLELDKDYDIREMGALHGCITLRKKQEDISAEAAAGILLKAKKDLDDAGISFRAIDLRLEKPGKEEPLATEDFIMTNYMQYESIYEEGLAERIEKADARGKIEYRAKTGMN